MQCTCGSYAINHSHHGRDGSDGDKCDVCYWRSRAEQLTAALRAEREVIVAEALKYADKSGRLEAKVDRLADELRKITELRERHHDNLHDAVTIAADALRDHDQEAGNG